MAYSTDFDDLSHSLIKLDAATEASESQGLLCGILCAQGRIDKMSWMQQVLGEAVPQGDLLIQEVKTELENVFNETMEALYDDEYGFQMFLPDDDVSLNERLAALSEWCQGFLLGFSMRDKNSLEGDLKDEIDSLIEDFVELTRIDTDTDEEMEDDEESFFEIIEYVRMGVIYIFTSLHPITTSNRLQ